MHIMALITTRSLEGTKILWGKTNYILGIWIIDFLESVEDFIQTTNKEFNVIHDRLHTTLTHKKVKL